MYLRFPSRLDPTAIGYCWPPAVRVGNRFQFCLKARGGDKDWAKRTPGAIWLDGARRKAWTHRRVDQKRYLGANPRYLAHPSHLGIEGTGSDMDAARRGQQSRVARQARGGVKGRACSLWSLTLHAVRLAQGPIPSPTPTPFWDIRTPPGTRGTWVPPLRSALLPPTKAQLVWGEFPCPAG